MRYSMHKMVLVLLIPVLFISCLTDYSTDEFEFIERKLNNKEIMNIVFESDGTAWMASYFSGGHGLIKIDTSGSVNSFDGENSPIDPELMIQDMEVDNLDRLWIGNDGLIMHENGVFTQYNTSTHYMPGNYMASIASDQLGKVWAISRSAGFWTALISVENDSVRVFDETSSNIPSELVVDVEIDQNNDVWILAIGNLYKFDGSTWEILNLDSLQLSSYTISNFAIDNDDRILGVLTYTNTSDEVVSALFMYDEGETTLYGTEDTMFRHFEIDKDNRAWYCNEMNILKYYDGENIVAPKFSHDAAVAAIAPDGKLWIGGLDGLFIYEQ